MGTTSGALGFVQGLQGGMAHTDKRRRDKAIDNMLDREAYESDLDMAARKKEFEKVGGDMAEFPEFSNPAEKDPMLVRGFNWLKGKFGFGAKPDDLKATAGLTEDVGSTQDEGAIQPQMSPSPLAPSGKLVDYADGGTVGEEERKRRSYGEYYVTEEEAAANRADRSAGRHRNRNPYHQRYSAGVDRQKMYSDTSGGGVREAAGDIKRAAIPVFDDTIQMAQEGQADVDAANRAFSEAEGARETGGAIRDVATAHIRHKGATALGVAKDVFVDNPITQGVAGFLGFDGKRGDPQPDPSTPPAGAAEAEAAPTAAIEASLGEGDTDAKVADQAVSAAVEMTPGHPDSSDQAFDWSEVAASGVTPEDIPQAMTSDWANYRKLSAEAAALRGDSVEEGQQEITNMQMQGFASNAQQSAFLLRQGDARGAALAMRMAYQYFPNGSDVRFGIAEGTTGPVLVGMGYDEESGEPVGESEEPMLLTPDVINAYVNQVSDPSSWNAWTKDWHEMAQEDRQYQEIDKPTAQAELDLTGAKTEYYQSGAAANRAEAAAGGGKPMTQSDKDRAHKAFTESQELTELEDPRMAQELAANMADLYVQLAGRLQYPEIINLVMGVNNGEYTLREGLAQYGIETGQ